MDHKNPLKMIDPVTGIEMTMQPPMPANQMGAAKPMFDQTTQNVAQQASPNTCLLYTSPSPRDGLLSRMPSSA